MIVTVKFSLPGFLLLLLCNTCSRPQEPDISDASYLPIKIGSIAEFEVVKTIYALNEAEKVSKHALKQSVTGSFTNLDGQLVHKLEYFTSSQGNAGQPDSVTILWQTIDKALMQENGQTIVKMLFPLYDGSSWNGNMYNAMPETMFTCVNKGKAVQIGQVFYPNTVQIIRQNDSTLLSRNTYTEIYAADIGLIQKEKVFLKYCYTPDCIGKGVVASGFKEISVLKTYSQK